MDSFTLEHTAPVDINAQYQIHESALFDLSNISYKYKKEALEYTNTSENSYTEAFEELFEGDHVSGLVELVENEHSIELKFNPLIYAIVQKDGDKFKELSEVVSMNESMVYYAIVYDCSDILEYILSRTCDINSVDNNGNRFLDVAIHTSCIEKNSQALDKLLDRTDLQVDYKNRLNESPLLVALKTPFFTQPEKIINHLNFNVVDDGDTEEIINNSFILSPQSLETLSKFIKNDDLLFMLWAKNITRLTSIIDNVLNCFDKMGNSLLYYAVCYGRKQIVQQFIKSKNIDYSHTNILNQNIIELAQELYQEDIYLPLLRNAIELVDNSKLSQIITHELLLKLVQKQSCPLKYGAIRELLKLDFISVNCTDDEGNTPLMHAVLNGDLQLIKLLLMNPQTYINPKNHVGETPLTTLLQKINKTKTWTLDNCTKAINMFLLDPRLTTEEKNTQNDKSETLLLICLKLLYGVDDRWTYNSEPMEPLPISPETLLSPTVGPFSPESDSGDKYLIPTDLNKVYTRMMSEVHGESIPSIPLSGPAPFPGNIVKYYTKFCHDALTKVVMLLLSDPKLDVNVRDTDDKNAMEYVTQNNDKTIFHRLLKHPMIDLNNSNYCKETTLYSLINKYLGNKYDSSRSISSGIHKPDEPCSVNLQISPSSIIPQRILPQIEPDVDKQKLSPKVWEFEPGSDSALFKEFTPPCVAYSAPCSNPECLYYFIKMLINDPRTDINYQNMVGDTYLLIAVSGDTKKLLFNLLIKHPKIDVNLYNFKGYSPLMVALNHQNWGYVRQLVKSNADPEYRNEVEGFNVADLVTRNGVNHIFEHIVGKPINPPTKKEDEPTGRSWTWT